MTQVQAREHDTNGVVQPSAIIPGAHTILCVSIELLVLRCPVSGSAQLFRTVNHGCTAAQCAKALLEHGGVQVIRVTFAREVTDERDAQSTLTMLAQVAWEKERNYIPIMAAGPAPVAS